jgi:pimeloyl-ACP methyl ester carboxylesterase
MSEPTTRTVSRPGGVELSVTEAGPADGPLVVLAHGFPELAWSWRHQVPALAEAGYHVLAPDQRGYGRSTQPADVEAYDIAHLTDDLVALIDDAGRERAAIVGHDWGSMVVWGTAQRHPGRVAGVVGMSVPFVPRGDHPPTSAMRHLLGDAFFYMLYFQEPGVADADLDADPERTMRGMLLGMSPEARATLDPAAMFANDGRGFVDRLPQVEGVPGWITEEEVRHYVEEFRRTGFTGGINWYRNLDRNWELMEPYAGQEVQPPARFVGGAEDPVLMMTPPAVQDGWLADDRGTVIVPGAGHWVQQEKPAEVNTTLLEFLDGLDPF